MTQLIAAAKVLNCSVMEVYEAPLHWRLKALAHSDVMQKAQPGLEKIAKQRARMKLFEERMNGG